MEIIGLDLHQRESQRCILTVEGELVEQRIATSRERFTAVLGSRAPARVLLEASTESEWVARRLEPWGHEVVVADPNVAPMDATRSRRVKTDRRDARTLAEACRLGAFRRAHRASDPQRQVRAELVVRDVLLRARTRWLLVEAGWRILRTPDPAAAALRAWAEGIALRRGRSIAAVALARRLAGIL